MRKFWNLKITMFVVELGMLYNKCVTVIDLERNGAFHNILDPKRMDTWIELNISEQF